MTGPMATTASEPVAEVRSAPRDPSARPELVRTAVALLPTVAIAAVVVVHAVVLGGRSYFQDDDIYQFWAAHDFGLGRQLLGLNVFMHFAPLNRFAHWAALVASPLNTDAGLVVSLIALALSLVAFDWLLREVDVAPVRRAVVIGLLGCSLPLFMTSIWFDSGVHTYGALAVICAVTAAGVRAVRTDRRRWAVTAVALLFAGFTVQVRVVFAVPLLALVLVLVVDRETSLGDRLRRLRSALPLLAALTLVGLAAALLERYFYGIEEEIAKPSVTVLPELIVKGLGGYLAPALFGRPLERVTKTTLVVTGVASLAVATALIARCRSNWGPIAMFGILAVVHFSFLYLGLLIVAGADSNASRLDYMTYLAFPLALVLATVRLDLPPLRTPTFAVATLVVVALGAGMVTGANRFIAGPFSFTQGLTEYFDAVRASRGTWDASDVTLVPLQGPPALNGSWVDQYLHHEALLALITGERPSPELHARRVALDLTGSPVDVQLAALARGELDSAQPYGQLDQVGGGCYAGSGDTDPDVLAGLNVPLDERVEGSAMFVVMRYSLRPGLDDVRLASALADDYTANIWTFALPEGERTVVLPLDVDGSADSVELGALAGAERFCPLAVDVVAPFIPFVGDQCQFLDKLGGADTPEACPLAWTPT